MAKWKATHNLVVKNGSYENDDGEDKVRYLRIGTVLTNKDGDEFILMDRTFNPAGVPVEDPEATQISISKFEIDDEKSSKKKTKKKKKKSKPVDDDDDEDEDEFDDDIPF